VAVVAAVGLGFGVGVARFTFVLPPMSTVCSRGTGVEVAEAVLAGFATHAPPGPVTGAKCKSGPKAGRVSEGGRVTRKNGTPPVGTVTVIALRFAGSVSRSPASMPTAIPIALCQDSLTD
jgi:hypothetical protein